METNKKVKKRIIVVSKDEVIEIYADKESEHYIIITNKNGILQVEGI